MPSTPKCVTHCGHPPIHMPEVRQGQESGWGRTQAFGEHISPGAGDLPDAKTGCVPSRVERTIQTEPTPPCTRVDSANLTLSSGLPASASWCWPEWALLCSPGLAATQPQEAANTPQPPPAGGTVPAARMAGSSFADVSEAVLGPGLVHPISPSLEHSSPGPTEKTG